MARAGTNAKPLAGFDEAPGKLIAAFCKNGH